ncbi:protein kinase domain-containing protein [Dictyobacter arantiisoli]|uniref:non-specific serine/threonine protein kinase n=1 Tax=Dictyobacter arantiisoli TaxID=2014874 RepID=A0A5A5T8V3_9CHLR|nr:kelch repeat-containing protein [Dictyobacter arantiisoli]GCF07419.1 hypothetical protein KDI_09830 [Dictyobacter arantiisoli]
MIPSEHQAAPHGQFVGRILHDGEYQVKQLFAQGPAHTIYLATHTTLSLSLMLKQIRADQPLPESVVAELDYMLHGGDMTRRTSHKQTQDTVFPSSGGAYTDRFLREALLLVRLQHPVLPTLYDYFSEDGYWYLVINYIPGTTLRHQMQQYGYLSPHTALGYAIQICDVLDYLHRQQPAVIFGALQPDTVMVTPSSSILLIDFGCAHHLDGKELPPELCAESSPYTAPEEAGGQVDIRTDLYSLGVLVREMIHEPLQQEAGPAIHPSSSIMLRGILNLATQAEKEERFQSAHTFFLALERAYRIEERLSYQRLLLNEAHTQARVHQTAPRAIMFANNPTEEHPSVLDLEQRHLARESLQRIRLERMEQEQIEQQLASFDANLQRRSSMSLSQLSLYSPEMPSASVNNPTPRPAYLFHRFIQISFILALTLFIVMASLLINARVIQPESQRERNHLTSESLTRTASASSNAPPANSWLKLNSLPEAEADHASVYVEIQGRAYIYMNGGYRGGSGHRSYDHHLYRYDIAATRWETVAGNQFPGMVNDTVVVTEKQTLFFNAGYSSDSYNLPSLLYSYQPATEQLTKIVPPAPFRLGFAGALFADQQGHLYLTQGFLHAGKPDTYAGSDWYRYDIATNRWQRLADLPRRLGYVVLSNDEQGHILLFGGSADAGQKRQSAAIYRYDIATNHWSTLAQHLPQTISGASGCLITPTKLVIVGGYEQSRHAGKDTAWLTDLSTLHIQSLNPFPAGGSVLGAIACDGQGHAYMARGADNPGNPTRDFWELSLPATSAPSS